MNSQYERAALLDPDLPDSESVVGYLPSDGDISFYNQLFFNYITPLIQHGASKDLEIDDILRLPSTLKSKDVYKEFVSLWSYTELKTKHHPELWKILHELIFVEFWIAGFYRLASDCLLLISPLLVKQFVLAAQAQNRLEMIILSCIFLCTLSLQALCLQQYIHGSFATGSKVVSAATSAVFHSSLELRLHKLYPTKSIGEVNNLISKDASCLREFIVFAHNLWSCPLTMLIAVCMIIYFLGYAGLVSCVMLPLLIPIESYLMKKSREARKSILKHSDLRLQFINQMIDGIRTIKLTGLADFVRDKVHTLRNEELGAAMSSRLVEVTNVAITRSVTMTVTFCTFGVYILISKEPLTADKAFAALTVINVLARPLQVIPNTLRRYADAVVSVGRLQAHLYQALDFCPSLFAVNNSSGSLLGESKLSSAAVTMNHTSSHLDRINSSALSLTPTYYGVSLKNVTAIRPPQISVLRNTSISITTPGLTLVAGKNGSGKTTLLLTMLEELLINNMVSSALTPPPAGAGANAGPVIALGGSVMTFPKHLSIAYCGHEPWILNATAKQNILIGCRMSFKSTGGYYAEGSNSMMVSQSWGELESTADEELYQRCVCACALVDDFAQWKDGDATMIGDRGITISGGQKQRLSLARAMYSQAKIVLLDSSLSALDAVVASHVFSNAIEQMSKDRIVVMATHQAHLLQHAHRVVIIDNGSIVFDGDYGDMLQNDTDYSEILVESNRQPSPVPGGSGTMVAMTKLVVQPSKSSSIVSSKKQVIDKMPKKDKLESAPSALEESKSNVYWKYVAATGSVILPLAMVLSIATYGANAFGDYQLALWTDGYYGAGEYVTIYGIMLLTVISLHFARFVCYIWSGMNASKQMHSQLLDAILRSTFSFFDTTPSGQIITRFATDINTIDFEIPVAIATCTEAFLGIITGLSMVVIQSPVYTVLLIPLVYKYTVTRNLYRNPSKALKRLDSSSKSPLFSHFKETLEGLESIRSFKIHQTVIERHHELLDRSICARLNWDIVNRWLGIRLDMIGTLIVAFAAFSVALSGRSSAGVAGLLLSYAIRATTSLSLAVRTSTALENLFNSPERIFQYIDNESEEKHAQNKQTVVIPPMNDTQDQDGVEMVSAGTHKDVVLQVSLLNAQYAPTLPMVLNNVSFTLKKGTLVGICGRTGCGKSSLSLALAGGMGHSTGSITLNGTAMSDYTSLTEYRNHLQVFPQDYYLLGGSVRQIIDPQRLHQDLIMNELMTKLSAVIAPLQAAMQQNTLSLEFAVNAGGSNLSAGQKQLLVLLRAVLSRDAKVLILDEIFSNMDLGSAKRAMNLITKELIIKYSVSVLLIAHSLQDLALCDCVWVMNSGRIVEQGKPLDLLDMPASSFHKMLLEMGGIDKIQQLKAMISSSD